MDWRANRLVDALAKLAAASRQAPRGIIRLLESGKAAVRHGAALLGAVTHAANNHKLQMQRPDGTWGTRTIRDAQQPAKHRKRPREPLQAPLDAKPLRPLAAAELAALDDWAARGSVKRQRPASTGILARRRRAEVDQIRRRVEEMGASLVASGHRPSAQTRLEQLRQRVRARSCNSA